MGISLLVNIITKIDLSYLVIIINIPFIIIAYTQVAEKFGIRTLLAVLGLALVLQFVPFPLITSDKLLIAFFGGFFWVQALGFLFGAAVLLMEPRY